VPNPGPPPRPGPSRRTTTDPSAVNPPSAPALPAWRGLLWLMPAWVAVAWLVAKARWFWSSNPDLQFGYIVLLLCAYVFFEAWEKRPPPEPGHRPALALVLVGTGMATLFATQLYQAAYGLTPASMSGLGLGALLVVTANLSFVFGTAGLRRFGFPFGFLLISLPIPSVIQVPLVSSLQSFIATLNVETLNLAGIPAYRVGSLIQLQNGTVGVDEACSGIRSLQSSLMATLFIGYLSLRSNLLRSLLLAGGVFTALAGNFIRSLYLSYTASARGLASVGEVHDAAGWSILAFTAVGVALLAWYFARVEKAAYSAAAAATEQP